MHLEYFFTYQNELPDGVGYSLFGMEHIIWLIFCAVCIVCMARAYAGWTDAKRVAAERALGIFLVLLIAVRTFMLLLIGKMSVYELPLHLCSIAGFLCCLHSFVKWDWLGQVIYTLCLPGTVSALLFPNGVEYPAVHFITIESFLFHAGIVLYTVWQLMSKKIVPRLSALWKVLLFLLAIVPLVYVFNKKFHANYMFINSPSPGSPLEWLASFMGNPGYLIGYAALVLLCMVLMDLGYFLTAGRKRR